MMDWWMEEWMDRLTGAWMEGLTVESIKGWIDWWMERAREE